ncbi:hypothetical protein KFZ58_18920 [Virgibacillus sp. NKC19-16]|uniref:hypothetical protein n=1 Tax=Virgibacillus salidurans TaxID=2831673 RepID=UPI001F21720F|nr:hypothetical protein [Virgibacillus sp. NKC19-16]UJL46384.1 hypothetical protein KFZ58_18920 [Virgibacillus sp. NKC19-16]
MTASITVGLISTPGFPADICTDLMKELPELLEKTIDSQVTWESEVTVDLLVGVAEDVNQVLEKANNIKQENGWDYAISLTDLPFFFGKKLVVANASLKEGVAQISVPSFGLFPTRKSIRQSLLKLMENLYADSLSELENPKQTRAGMRKHKKAEKNPFSISLIKREEGYSNQSGADLRYVTSSRVIGYIRVLLGMTRANRPWKAFFSFYKVLALAFATGTYISIFSTPWHLSIIYSNYRMIFLMLLAIFGMVTWIIFSQNLWEKPSEHGKKRWRQLYNATTFLTLFSLVCINYIVLFGMFSISISLFVPPDLFQLSMGMDSDPGANYYFSLVWLITSLGTLAGAIGSGLEREEKIRDITYSFRQQQRSYEIGEEEDDEGSKKDSDDLNKEEGAEN